MASEDFPAPSEGFVLTHFIVATDVRRSRDFYTGVLGGKVVLDGVRVHLHMSFRVRLHMSFQQRWCSAVVMRAPSFGR